MWRQIFLAGVLLIATTFTATAAETSSAPSSSETLTLGGGCFWCMEAVFTELKGVTRVESGFAGGTVPNPSYERVSMGGTGHAEVVQITFDPQVIDRDTILRAFFTVHDPTTLNRQGADFGTQYRSVIFYHSEEQQRIAQEVIRELDEARLWNSPIVTEVSPMGVFYTAEEHHQDYFQRNMFNPYCQYVVAPKVEKVRKIFREKLKRA